VSPSTTEQRRHVVLDGAFNFRDLGGYATRSGRTVRWRRLFRADGIHRLSGADLELVGSLGVRTVIDLRTYGEVAQRGRFPADELGVDHFHLPVLEAVWSPDSFGPSDAADVFLAARYAEMLTVGGRSIATALDLLADPDRYPLVFHCAAGKDRTGVLAAVALELLGVGDDDIVGDYALSRLGMDRMVEWLHANAPEAVDAMSAQPQAFLEAPPSAMQLLLDAVRDRHGSMEGYVRTLGVPGDTVARLRTALLD
jgi:protein-tyrosine phosphatase